MAHDNRPSPVVSSLRINTVLDSNGDDKLRQALQNIRRRILVQTIASSVAGQVDDDQCSRRLKRLGAHDVSPHGPTIGKPVDEDS